MSLVGSLEDLGLGDILQIISLSRKSGVLMLRADGGEGQIVFSEGLIRGAFTDAGPSQLHELLLACEAVPKDLLEAAVEEARARGRSLAEVLTGRALLEPDRLEELRRDHIESSVLRMFTWSAGEFSFEIRESEDDSGEELFASPGVNPQFLALEGSRISDEGDAPPDDDPGEIEFGFSGEDDDPATVEVPVPLLEAAPLETDPFPVVDLVDAETDGEILDAEDLICAETEELPAAPAVAPPRPAPAAALARVPPVVVIDRDLGVLEWVKESLEGHFPRIHIFQRTEQGISRIRQYLARPELPLLLVAEDAPPDPLSGAQDASEIVHRLRAQAPRMQIVLMRCHDGESLPADAASAAKPTPTLLADPRCAGALRDLRATFRGAVEAAIQAPGQRAGEAPTSMSPDSVARLRDASARLRDPTSQGDVLTLVLRFAGEIFSRVALFMVREGMASGIAQLGLPRAGGPDDGGLREVELPCAEAAWFRRVIESGGSACEAPADDGDHRLAVLLGNAIPSEAYVAPVMSGHHAVALLYGDNLPAGAPIGDTSALEVLLHEAGLALDRAVLERALADAEGV